MNLFTQIESHLRELLTELLPDVDIAAASLAVEPPRDESHGDMATNAAMVLAKRAGKPPRELAEQIAAALPSRVEAITQAEVAGAGFVNITLAPQFWQQHIAAILAAGAEYGKQPETGEHINIEYVSANPTGPMHVGHARGAVVGDVLANLLEAAGCKITREYYINDAGGQIETLAQSVLLQAQEKPIPEGHYGGDYIIPIAEALHHEYPDIFGQDADAQMAAAKSVAVPMMLRLIKDDLTALGIAHDIFSSEKQLHKRGIIDEMLALLKNKDLIYEGILEAPKGKPPPDDWEEREQILFRATKFGDDSDRPLQKSNGAWTYFAADIAYHFDKFQRGFTQQINIWGADHAGYIKRLTAAVEQITDEQATLKVLTCNLVKLKRGGQEVKMSKRSGDFITLREVVDEVGKDAVRFMMLTRKNDAPLDFDFDLVKDKSRENPIFYVQYANARINSVLASAAEQKLPAATHATLTDPTEQALIKKLAAYPRTLAAAAAAREPHRLAFYLLEVAAAFHALWNKGKDDPALKFIREDAPAITADRIALLKATRQVLHCGMAVIGIEPAEELR